MSELRGKRVLIVEDEAFIAIDLEDCILASEGEVVDIAVDNASAIKAIETETIDVVLLDYNLIDGEAEPTAQAAKSKGVPVVFHSGHASKTELLKNHPDSTVLPKPTPRADIVVALAKVIGACNAGAQTDAQLASRR